MKIVWSSVARNAFADLARYLRDNASERVALTQSTRILDGVVMLATFPQAGRPGRIRDTRELVIYGTQHLVVYQAQPKTIYILAVLHGAQRWPSRLPENR